jgi:predicted enzyme related to lactoylglutathione lyase
MSRVVHFEIPARNIDTSRKFYSSVFGWKIEQWGEELEYYLVTTGDKGIPGIDGAIYKPAEGIDGVVNTIGVESLDETIEKVSSNGGEIVTPKQEIPQVGTFCYAKDPEGILLGILQPYPMDEM